MTTSTMLLMAAVIFFVTIASGTIPFVLKINKTKTYSFPIGESLANGVFLGAGLIHMLGDASGAFSKLGFDYPWAFCICGITFLVFLLSEYLGFFMKKNGDNQSLIVAVASTIMLSIHSFFTGAVLGITSSIGLSVILFFAILAHKWAASFSLSIYINKSNLNFSLRIMLFLIFSVMVPAGMFGGDLLMHYYSSGNLFQPIFLSIAAGTFIYLGTFHGFRGLLAGDRSSGPYQYICVVLGFALMAVVAIWL